MKFLIAMLATVAALSLYELITTQRSNAELRIELSEALVDIERLEARESLLRDVISDLRNGRID